MTVNEDLELQTLAEMVRKELFNNGCSIEYTGFPYELISDFPRRVSSGVDVSFVKNNVNYNVMIERSVYNNITKEFVFDMSAEYRLMEDQLPALTSLDIGDDITIVDFSPDGVVLRLRHRISCIAAESETIFSDEAEIAAVAKSIVARIIAEINKI